jgi:hypothetical protein
MAQIDTRTEGEARYLSEIREDCRACLGPGADLLDVRREPTPDGVRLVAVYRLGGRERASVAAGETMLAAHTALRARILVDRIRFGYADLLEEH